MYSRSLNWSQDTNSVADAVYHRVCRSHLDAPGFCVINLAPTADSVTLRQAMVQLKQLLSVRHHAGTGRTLVYLSVGRFDQQQTTRPHRDGGPDQSLLMLGYEPTTVASTLDVLDYSRCAQELGLTPDAFLQQHNPMFAGGFELLQPYTTRVRLSADRFQIVCINNSSAAYSASQPAWQGVLHTASVLTPDDSQRRVINSTMIASVPLDTPEPISEDQLTDFLTTSTVRRRGYDKPGVADDTAASTFL
ncbi:MAG: hypothetical protein NXI04_18065 [Planctomycetaceae bacterium]|nr:hypothetical protein [Planctomycetaceae bacterium]